LPAFTPNQIYIIDSTHGVRLGTIQGITVQVNREMTNVPFVGSRDNTVVYRGNRGTTGFIRNANIDGTSLYELLKDDYRHTAGFFKRRFSPNDPGESYAGKIGSVGDGSVVDLLVKITPKLLTDLLPIDIVILGHAGGLNDESDIGIMIVKDVIFASNTHSIELGQASVVEGCQFVARRVFPFMKIGKVKDLVTSAAQ